MFNKDTFDFTAFIAWMEQIVDFILSIFAKLGLGTNSDVEEGSTL